MRKKVAWIGIAMSLVLLLTAQESPLTIEERDGILRLESGSQWIHKFKLFGPFSIKNPPTMAIWITDEEGNFLESLYVSHKIGMSAWRSNQDNRPEALPTWSFMRGGQPTEDNPEMEDITSATPEEGQDMMIPSQEWPEKYQIWLEINHSTDYNHYFIEGIDDPSDPRFSGGDDGSGQPALVYHGWVEKNTSEEQSITLDLLGYSEPGGEHTGIIYPIGDEISTALEILESAQWIF